MKNLQREYKYELIEVLPSFLDWLFLCILVEKIVLLYFIFLGPIISPPSVYSDVPNQFCLTTTSFELACLGKKNSFTLKNEG